MFLIPGLYAQLPLKPTEDLSYPPWRRLVHGRLALGAPTAGLDAYSFCGRCNGVAYPYNVARVRRAINIF